MDWCGFVGGDCVGGYDGVGWSDCWSGFGVGEGLLWFGF